jgi:hypothetical protein
MLVSPLNNAIESETIFYPFGEVVTTGFSPLDTLPQCLGTYSELKGEDLDAGLSMAQDRDPRRVA